MILIHTKAMYLELRSWFLYGRTRTWKGAILKDPSTMEWDAWGERCS